MAHAKQLEKAFAVIDALEVFFHRDHLLSHCQEFMVVLENSVNLMEEKLAEAEKQSSAIVQNYTRAKQLLNALSSSVVSWMNDCMLFAAVVVLVLRFTACGRDFLKIENLFLKIPKEDMKAVEEAAEVVWKRLRLMSLIPAM